MNKRRVFSIVFIALTVLTALFIFANSMQSGTVSDSHSDPIIEKAASVISASDSADYHLLEYLKHLIRKSAHFLEFSLLGLFLFFSMHFSSEKREIFLLAGAFLGLVAAVIDELIQLYSVGRCSSVTDIIVDFGGIMAGLLIARLAIFIAERKRK